jgi:hypothetical protein
MVGKIVKLQKYLYVTSAIILLVGLSSAAMIYRAAMNDPINESGYEVLGGFVYSTTAENSKKYTHDLQLYGGNAAVLADEFMHWLAGLWHGKSLAVTVACITILLSLVFFLVAYKLPILMQSDAHSENKSDGAG